MGERPKEQTFEAALAVLRGAWAVACAVAGAVTGVRTVSRLPLAHLSDLFGTEIGQDHISGRSGR